MFNLRPIKRDDLELVLEWRNSERIRKNMINDQVISLEAHATWFENLRNRRDREIFLFSIGAMKVGIVSFIDINFEHRNCSCGFYIGEATAPKGTGTVMMYHALNYMFDKYNLHKIKAEVLEFNEASIEFHKNLKYRMTGVLKDEILRNDKYYDLILFSLFRTDWNTEKDDIYKRALQKMKGAV